MSEHCERWKCLFLGRQKHYNFKLIAFSYPEIWRNNNNRDCGWSELHKLQWFQSSNREHSFIPTRTRTRHSDHRTTARSVCKSPRLPCGEFRTVVMAQSWCVRAGNGARGIEAYQQSTVSVPTVTVELCGWDGFRMVWQGKQRELFTITMQVVFFLFLFFVLFLFLFIPQIGFFLVKYCSRPPCRTMRTGIGVRLK